MNDVPSQWLCRGRVASRSWRLLGGLALLLLCWSSRQGQSQHVQTDRFRFQRTIIPGGAGPNRLEIDIALLAGASPFREFSRIAIEGQADPVVIAKEGLADVRIYDSAGREVPYLLVIPAAPESQWTEARPLPIPSTKKISGFDADLGKVLRVSSLRITGIPAPFLKRVRLEGSGDRIRWTALVEEGRVFDLPAEKLKQLELGFEPGEYKYLRITWDDSASARVPLPGSVSARLVTADSLPPALRTPLQFTSRTSEPGVSRYQIRLPGSGLPITAVELSSVAGNVMRQARITEERLADLQMKPELLGLATLWHTARGSTKEAVLRIPISGPREPVIELMVQNGDNPPLELTGISGVFAYLPWIYFESPGRESLTARFGDRGLAAPRYDLEAMRETISKARTSEAHWGKPEERKPGEVEASVANNAISPGTAMDAKAFLYARPIPAGKVGLNALALDAAVLAHTRMFDLRIAGADGRQIPYLLEKRDEPLTVALPALEKAEPPAARNGGIRPGTQSVNYYALRLPYANIPASRLVLATRARVFQRAIVILAEKDPHDARAEPWTYRIASSQWSHTDPDTPSPPLWIPLPALQASMLRVAIDEGDNSALPIAAATLLLPSYRMRFFRQDGADLTLYYSNENIEAPRYDIALLAPYLIGALADEVSLPADRDALPGPATGPGIQTIVFWLILGLAVILLLILIARLLGKGIEPN
jgi:hypothetical protein